MNQTQLTKKDIRKMHKEYEEDPMILQVYDTLFHKVDVERIRLYKSPAEKIKEWCQEHSRALAIGFAIVFWVIFGAVVINEFVSSYQPDAYVHMEEFYGK
jgi:hypothetical protein